MNLLSCRNLLIEVTNFFLGGYIHDVLVCRPNTNRDLSQVFVKSKCWASQKKSKKYTQKIIFQPEKRETQDDDPAVVSYSVCEECPAGQEGGLCQHIFALLLAVEHYGPRNIGNSLPGEEPVTSLKQRWGPREQEVKPKAMFQNVVEKAKMADERKQSPAGPSLFES